MPPACLELSGGGFGWNELKPSPNEHDIFVGDISFDWAKEGNKLFKAVEARKYEDHNVRQILRPSRPQPPVLGI